MGINSSFENPRSSLQNPNPPPNHARHLPVNTAAVSASTTSATRLLSRRSEGPAATPPPYRGPSSIRKPLPGARPPNQDTRQYRTNVAPRQQPNTPYMRNALGQFRNRNHSRDSGVQGGAANQEDGVSSECEDRVPNQTPRCKRPRDQACRSEWSEHTLRLVDRTADDTKAFLVSVGYMKSKEEREEIILQAWECSNLYFRPKHARQNITARQIQYIQNLLSPCRKLMKTRLEGKVAAVFHLCDGTEDDIAAHIKNLVPHGFHSIDDDERGTLYFENPFIKTALVSMVFRGPRDLGVKFNAYFNPIPPETVAFACAMIEDIICEYDTGEHRTKPTRVDSLVPMYNTYLTSLRNLRTANRGRYESLLMRLYDGCVSQLCVLQDNTEPDVDDAIPVDAFDATPVERYVPRFKPSDVQSFLNQVSVFGDESNEYTPENSEQIEKEYYDDEPDNLSDLFEQNNFGEPGPGPQTLGYRARQFNREILREDHELSNYEQEYESSD